MRLAGPGRAAGRRVGTDLPDERLVATEHLAPGPDGDVGLLATDRDVRVRRVGDAQELVVEGRLGLGQGGVELGDAGSGGRRRGAQVGHLRAVGRGAALDRLADPLRRGVSLRLERLALAEEAPALGVELEGTVDERRVLALADGSVADRVGVVAKPLETDAHDRSPAVVAGVASAASRSRRTTNSLSSDARSQPARGPFSRPRNAR